MSSLATKRIAKLAKFGPVEGGTGKRLTNLAGESETQVFSQFLITISQFHLSGSRSIYVSTSVSFEPQSRIIILSEIVLRGLLKSTNLPIS